MVPKTLNRIFSIPKKNFETTLNKKALQAMQAKKKIKSGSSKLNSYHFILCLGCFIVPFSDFFCNFHAGIFIKKLLFFIRENERAKSRSELPVVIVVDENVN